MRKILVRLLLRALNTSYLNGTPCEYGFIGNVDAFSLSHLRYEVMARPDLTVAKLIEEADLFRSCPMKDKLMVIQDGEFREATGVDVSEFEALYMMEGRKRDAGSSTIR